MFRHVARWLGVSLVMLFTITALTFVLASMAPGDAAKAIRSVDASGAGAISNATAASYVAALSGSTALELSASNSIS